MNAWLTSALRRSRAYANFWKTFGILVVLDQMTKCLIALTLDFPTYGNGYGSEPVAIIPGFFNLVNVHNDGAAWSMFAGQQFWLSAFAIVCLAAIFFARKSLEIKNSLMQIPMGLLCGGIVGNLIDRIFHGVVIDFLDVILPIFDYRWPAFNVADCGICLGVFCFIGLNLLSYFREVRSKIAGHRPAAPYDDIDDLSRKK